MNYDEVAAKVAHLVRTEPIGTKITVWADGAVTRSFSAENPILVPGSSSRPMAFFVAGLDQSNVADIDLRLRRAARAELRVAS